MALFSTQPRREASLIFDVGSGSVGGALVSRGAGKPLIIHSVRALIAFAEENRANRLFTAMQKALAQVLLSLVHEGLRRASAPRPRIGEAFVFLSAPWVASRMKFLHLGSPTPVVINDDVFRALLEEQGTHSAAPKGGIIMEQKLIKAELNGYEVARPYGKTATDASFAIFMSFALPRVLSVVSESITRAIQPARVTFHSFILSACEEAQELFPNRSDFLIVDVSGEQTELAAVKRGAIVEILTFPFGRNHFLRKIGKGGAPVAARETFLRLHLEGKGEGALYEKLRREMRAASEEWLTLFSKGLSALAEKTFVPRAFIALADENIKPIIESAVRNADVEKRAAAVPFLEVIPFGAEELAPLLAAGSDKDDSFLSIEALFSQKLRMGR